MLNQLSVVNGHEMDNKCEYAQYCLNKLEPNLRFLTWFHSISKEIVTNPNIKTKNLPGGVCSWFFSRGMMQSVKYSVQLERLNQVNSSSELCEKFKKYYKCILTECRSLDSKSVLVVGKNPKNFAFLQQPKQIFERDSSFFM